MLKAGNPPYILSLITPYRPSSNSVQKLPGKNVFIVSSGRTGTKFIADYFGQMDGVSAVHEPKGSRLLRMWTTAKVEGRVTDDDLARVLYQKRSSVKSHKSAIRIESNPYLSGFSGILDEVFENSTIIHIVRDPRTYVKSALDHGNADGIKNIFNSYVPFWYPDVAEIIKNGRSITPKLRAAYYWKIINELLLEEGSKQKNYHHLKFEDIFDESGKGLDKLGKIIGVEVNLSKDNLPQAINKSRGTTIDDWQSWSSNECRDLDKIWQPLTKKYGYCQEKAWKDKISG